MLFCNFMQKFFWQAFFGVVQMHRGVLSQNSHLAKWQLFFQFRVKILQMYKTPKYLSALMDMSWVVMNSILLRSKILVLEYLVHSRNEKMDLMWFSCGLVWFFQLFYISSLPLFLSKACVICYLLLSNG